MFLKQILALLLKIRLQVLWVCLFYFYFYFLMPHINSWQLVGSPPEHPTVGINAASTSVLILADSTPLFLYFQAIQKHICTKHINTIIAYFYYMHNFSCTSQKYLTIFWLSCFLPGGRDMLLV